MVSFRLIKPFCRLALVAMLLAAVVIVTSAEAQTTASRPPKPVAPYLLPKPVACVAVQREAKEDSVSPGTCGTNSPAGGQANGTSPANRPLPRLSFGGKFRYFAKDERLTFIAPAFSAAITMANPPHAYPREWRQGGEAFGRNYGDGLASTTATRFTKFLTGAVLREDPRYYPSTTKNVFSRTLHAIAFTFVDKSDSGHDTLALSNFSGAVAGGFVGNAYLPDYYSNASHAAGRSAIALAGLAGENLCREFSPELKAFAKKLHVPFVH